MKSRLANYLALAFVLFLQFSFAQERTVTGTVTDGKGMTIAGASVMVKGTKQGTQTDFDGKFKISASTSQTLVFSFIGMLTKEVVASSSVVNVKLEDNSKELEGVVVTSLGIKKQKKSLGYSTATATGKDLTEVNNTNVFESLSGKLAGVDISAPAQVGASSKVVVRGFNSLNNNAGVLYVVDGTPITNRSSSDIGIGRSFDAGNGIGDLDPNNIESMTVLKGAAASALYGSRAGQGVIIITTKSGKNKSKIAVEVNSSTDFAEVARVAKFQNQFGQGWNAKSYSNWGGQPSNNASNENGSWGPAFNGEVRPWGSIYQNSQQIKPYVALENNMREFYDIGTTFTNNIRLSGGGENSNFSLGITDVNSDGVIPTNADSYKRQTVGLNAGVTGEKLSFKTSINYVRKRQNAVNTGQGEGSGEGDVLAQEILQMPRDISITDLKDYKNNPFNSNDEFFTPYASNPYWSINENSTKIDGNRIFGNANIAYNFNKKFSISYQAGGDYSNEKVKSYGAVVRFSEGSPQDVAAKQETVGGVTESTRESIEYDTNLILNYNTNLSEKVKLNSSLGFNTNERRLSFIETKITNLSVPNFYELTNTSIKPQVDQNDSLRRSYGVFATLETSFADRLFLTLTGRNDWTSTLPKGNNSYFYPSVALSGIAVDNAQYFLKLRAAYAKIANDTDPYQTSNGLRQGNAILGFGNIFLPFDGVNGFEYAGNLGNPDIKPEITDEFEVGFESNLFSKRLNLDVALYNRTTKDLLFQRPLPASTGFVSQTGNILDLRNKGIEVTLNVVPIKTENFQWDLTTTFTKNDSEVLSIVGGVDKINLDSQYNITFNAKVGEPLGTFDAPVPKRNAQGQYIVNPDTGYYAVTDDEQKIGDSQRDFIMGFKNRISYKNVTLNIGVDWKQGGEMYSYTKRLSHFTGNGIETTYNNRNNFVIPNSVNEVLDANGVVTGYAENSTPITFEGITDYWNPSQNPAIESTHLIDKTFVRLRDVSFVINAPANLAKRWGLANASLTFYGKNLALWTPNSNSYVDPELSTFGSGLLSEQGEFGTNPSQRSYGVSVKLTF
jgi:TonB-linked SusC/RagA family outer membrane protein